MSKYLTIEQRETLAAQLAALIAKMRTEIAEALRQHGSDEAIGFANHLEEIDDDAVADLETSLEIASLERDLHEMRDAESALQRLHTLEYGTCIDCQGEIPYSRLHASPAALRCIRCQTDFERVWQQTALHTL